MCNVRSIPDKNGLVGFAQVFQIYTNMKTVAIFVNSEGKQRLADETILPAIARAIASQENEIIEDHGINFFVVHHPTMPEIVMISWGVHIPDNAICFYGEELLLQIDPFLLNQYLTPQNSSN